MKASSSHHAGPLPCTTTLDIGRYKTLRHHLQHGSHSQGAVLLQMKAIQVCYRLQRVQEWIAWNAISNSLETQTHISLFFMHFYLL